MLDKSKTWVEGRIELEEGAVLHFEFSPNEETGGGEIKLCGSTPESDKLLRGASTLFGSKLKELLAGGKLLFSTISSQEPKEAK